MGAAHGIRRTVLVFLRILTSLTSSKAVGEDPGGAGVAYPSSRRNSCVAAATSPVPNSDETAATPWHPSRTSSAA